MLPYRKAEAADLDLLEIWSCVSQNGFEAADRVLSEIEQHFGLLAEHPLAGRARPELAPNLRSLSSGSYIIYYRVLNDVVEIVRVLNAARDIGPLFGEL